jgi:multimeric flavodoxin WrbA
MFGTFVSTGTPGGGQELTAFQSLSVAIHQGMVYVPIGYQIPSVMNLDEVHGGSPWGNPCDLSSTDTSRRGDIRWDRWLPSAVRLGVGYGQVSG